MYGNGCLIAGVTTTRSRGIAPAECFAVAVGTPMPLPAGLRFATAALRLSATITWASAWRSKVIFFSMNPHPLNCKLHEVIENK